MASPGPGYNPQESLLSGGTAPIVPVQGGGGYGQPPPGYNETQSLLQGGTATIEPTRGGAVGFDSTVKVGVGSKPSSENTTELLKGSTKKPLEKYRIDQYKVPEGISTPAKDRSEKKLYKKYVEKNGTTEELINLESGQSSKNTSRPLFDVCKAKAPAILFQTIPRKIHVIDKPDVKLWIIPPLKGKLSQLAGILKVIGVGEDMKMKPNEYLIFQAPFFASGLPKDNPEYLLLFTMFLELKDVNENRVFILNHLSDKTVKYGCSIAKTLHSDPSKKRLPVFFEPDVLVFLKQKILFRSDSLPITKEGWKVSSLLEKMKDPNYSKSLLLRPDASKGSEKIEGFFEFVGGAMEETSLPGGTAATKGCPGYECPEFIKSIKMDSKALVSPQALRDSSLYLVWSTDKRLPYLKKEGSSKKEEVQEEEVQEEEVEEEEEEVPETNSETKPVIKKPKTETLEEEDEDLEESEDCIEGTSTDTKADVVTFYLTGSKIEVREATTLAKQEWKQGVFTPKEAELLCLLHLSAKLLQELFGDDKWIETSDFLESLSLSKCYEDSTLLLQRECSKARKFLRKIYMDRFVTLLDIYTGKTLVKASKKTSNALTQLMSKFRDVTLQKDMYSMKLDQLHEITAGLEKKLSLGSQVTQIKNQEEFNKALETYQTLTDKKDSGKTLNDGEKDELKEAERIINKFEKKYPNDSSNPSIILNSLTSKLKGLTLT